MHCPAQRVTIAAVLVALLTVVCIGSMAAGTSHAADSMTRPNVLFICIDDLRPELGCYGAEHVISPNIDHLSSRGVTFDQCHVQIAVCNPSRASTFTGLRPDRLGVYTLRTHFREAMPDAVTLPEYLRAHGYHCESLGKIFHNPWPDPRSWDRPHEWGDGSFTNYTEKQQALRKRVDEQLSIDAWQKGNLRGPITNAPDIPDEQHSDGSMATKAIKRLEVLKEGDRPFFLAAGFILPHLPWTPPKSWWDRYDRATLPLATNTFPPKGAPEIAIGTNYELSHYADMVDMPTPYSGSVTEETARRFRHAYYASTSFIDAQVGRLLNALDDFGLAENTIVVLWSDHGWKLGEHNAWGKMTNFENDTRIPMIIFDPNSKANGRRCGQLVESLDLFPTVCDLTETPIPDNIDGRSLASLLDDPETKHRDAVFSQYVREGMIGNAIRTDRWRYIEWRTLEDGVVESQELYDHIGDPEENQNVFEDFPDEGRRLSEDMGKALSTGPLDLRAVVHSKSGGEPVGIRWSNEYQGDVRVTWINPMGHRKQFVDLKAGEKRDYNTYVGHVFAVESLDGEYFETVEVVQDVRHMNLAQRDRESPKAN